MAMICTQPLASPGFDGGVVDTSRWVDSADLGGVGAVAARAWRARRELVFLLLMLEWPHRK